MLAKRLNGLMQGGVRAYHGDMMPEQRRVVQAARLGVPGGRAPGRVPRRAPAMTLGVGVDALRRRAGRLRIGGRGAGRGGVGGRE